MKNAETLRAICSGLIVSCQARPGEPLAHPRIMTQLARAVVNGGASAVRAEGLENIRAVVQGIDVPVIGLRKVGHDGVYITPTLDDAHQVADAGAHVVAIDGTRRPRPDGLTLQQTVQRLRKSRDVHVMADCGSLGDAEHAIDAGADLIGTTLAGYTGERPITTGPDLELLRQMVNLTTDVPVIAEGRYWTIDHVREAICIGADAVCVGSAITRPTLITRRFATATSRVSTTLPANLEPGDC
ncbi:N-acetylmannosamine-6-phosphate 2-epimerase [Phytoactinopolyspora endophytica]|uniref:N-acetylmannosamine-6-phosphate 2-epimerase n=1 Tax=Phytoactinopolyspora endophytica TaxID=1642495 RepID=UPI00101D1812|nr:N-acetylmannosamine-6-phosphate 2-epimerase [Phytoactinopolyspora endophytica]